MAVSGNPDRAPSLTDEWRTKPARKDRARWCGGHEGREHRPVVVMDKNLAGLTVCKPAGYGRDEWLCIHITVCEVCGRVLRYLGEGTECPDRPTDAEAGR